MSSQKFFFPRMSGGRHPAEVCLSVHTGRTPPPCYKIAIPSANREEALCQQTLQTLQRQEWRMAEVYVFVHPACLPGDSETQLSKYQRCLAKHGFADVTVVPGGSNLMLQYNQILCFFPPEERIILMSDTIPSIVWRKHTVNLTLVELPPWHLQAHAALGFQLCSDTNSHAWSLGPCKSPGNMQPGHISRRLGLLDGNCFGLILRGTSDVRPQISGYITDVEMSLRCWCLDNVFHRFLGVTALHKYRSAGGHACSAVVAGQRSQATDAAIETLAHMLRHTSSFTPTRISDAGMRYKFKHHGGLPLMVRGGCTSTGRPAITTGRAMTAAQRQRKSRHGSVAPRKSTGGAPPGNQNAVWRRDVLAPATGGVHALILADLDAVATRLTSL